MGRFDGKLALITGSTKGIGYATAERLASEGACIIITSRKQKNVDDAVGKLKQAGHKNIYGITAHAGNIEDSKKLVQFAVSNSPSKKIDILVANAAANPHFGNMFDCQESHWDKIFQVNLKGAFFLVKESRKYLSKGSSVILVSSFAGYSDETGTAIYNIHKTALLQMTRMLANVMAKDRVRVNCIAPGVIPTKLSQPLIDNEELSRQVSQKIPMKRFGKPEECASVVAFLASQDASYVTGETIVMAGGMRSRL